MSRSLVFSLLIILIDSCSFSQNSKYVTLCRDEDELINQVFWELIITSPPCNLESMSQEENEIYWSEYYSKLETGEFEVYVKDSLLTPNKSKHQNVTTPVEFRQLCADLFSNPPSKSRKFEIVPNPTMFKIKIVNDYKIDSIFNKTLLNNSFLGEIKFSRVAFDKNKLKACLTQTITRNVCSKVYLILCVKQSSKWKVIRKILISQ